MRKFDSIAIFFINLVLLVLFALGESSTVGALGLLRVVLGLVYLLYIPGYAIQEALFPRREQLGSLDRLALSIGLSVAIMPVLGLALDGPPGGIFLWQSFIFLALLTTVCSLVALYRRSRLIEQEEQAHETEIGMREWWQSQTPLGQMLFALVPAAILIGAILVLYVFYTPSPDRLFTEFYTAGESGVAANYPLEVIAGEPFTLSFGVTNHEGQGANYTIKAQMNGQDLAATAPFTLVDGQSISLSIALAAPIPGNEQLMEILLLRDKQVYRRLYLQMDVKSQ